MIMKRRRRQAPLVLGILVLVLVSCVPARAPLQPQVLVTRVPAKVRSQLAPQPEVSAAPAVAPMPTAEATTDLPLEVGPAESQPSVLEPEETAAGMPADTSALTTDQAVAETRAVAAAEATTLQQTHNVLLLGTDERNLAYLGRTDTIMLLALDMENQRAALISFPRDIYLPIPGVGYSRINSAYFLGESRQEGGGIPLLISTFEKNFDIPIHSYVRIDLSGFEQVVDALGGVDITLDCPLYDETLLPYFGTAYLEAGDYHMNGPQALFYSRSRKTTSDFDRARRQQQVLIGLRNRVLDAGLVTRVPALWTALRGTVDTDLKARDVVELAKLGASLGGDRLYGMVLRPPLVNDWVTPQGAQVQLPDLPAIAEALDHIWERKPLLETNVEERFCGPNGA